MDSSLNRRAFFDVFATSFAALAVSQLAGCADSATEARSTEADESERAQLAASGGPHIVMLLYPGLTMLDLIGPHTCFMALNALGMKTHLVWKTRDPITSDAGVTVTPTTTFADCPEKVDLLFVPGSASSTMDMVRDREVLSFLHARGQEAKLVTSVCTGSIILGAAGLLRGYRATSHWITRDLLAQLEATPVSARYVEDRNRITGAGVTSGIDFGLRVVARLAGRGMAESTQLTMEYDPEPPFSAGSPETAPALSKLTVTAAFAGQLLGADKVLTDARAKFNQL